MFVMLSRSGVRVTRAEVHRAYAELGLLKKRVVRRVRTTRSNDSDPKFPNLVQGLQIERPNQVWVADVTYVRIRARFAFLALLMDVYTRRILGWNISFANDTALTLSALKMALEGGERPEIHHTDRGATYGPRYQLPLLGTQISMAAAGRPHENGHAERLNRTVKEEEIYFSDYRDLPEARDGIAAFVRRYNNERIHSALAYATPSECLKNWLDKEGR
jgi:transposase InsO family protein